MSKSQVQYKSPIILYKLKYTPASCEIEYFVETHLCKLCVMYSDHIRNLRSHSWSVFSFFIIYYYKKRIKQDSNYGKTKIQQAKICWETFKQNHYYGGP